MDNKWIEKYLLLALRMDRAFQKTDPAPFLDTYYGPARLKKVAEAEKGFGFAALAEQAKAILEELDDLGFDESRRIYLSKHLEAIETIGRIKNGEEIPFFVQLEKIFDIEPKWIPEEEFELALKMLDQALPGKGDIRDRFTTWLERSRLPAEDDRRALSLAKELLSEARRRTNALIPLPEGEELCLEGKRNVNYGAANWYQGGYKSRMEINLDRPVYPLSLMYQMCHEGYPGHHTEACLKEQHLFRGKGYLEQSVFFSLGPQLLIAEGIASTATAMIFTVQEAADWMREHVLPMLGQKTFEADLSLILQAYAIISPDDLSSNLATLIEAGRSLENILDYALTYSPFSVAQVRRLFPWLQSPLARLYAFTYSHGKRIILPLLGSPQREYHIRRLLTEQIVPSSLLV